jgi:hypothetical protein
LGENVGDMNRRWLARVCVGALGGLGIAFAHWAAYLIATPDAHAHQALLESTGHRYWPLAGAFLVALVVGTTGVSVSARFGRASGRPTSFARAVAVLGTLQVFGFLLLEFGERLLFAAHHSAASLFTEPVVLLGMGLQAAVAIVAAFILRALLRVVRFVRALLRSRVGEDRSSTPLWVPGSQVHLVPLAPGTGGFSLRGPPAPLLN